MANGKTGITKVYERLGIVETKQDNTQAAVADLTKILRSHMSGHWRDFLWSIPTIIIILQFVLSLVKVK